jgi:hypothetical protein
MLRKIFLTLPLAALFFIELNAQTTEGTFLIGTNGNASYAGRIRGMNYDANLKTGYFFKDNLLIGTEFQKSKIGIGNVGSNTTYGVGLFARKYFDLKNPKWKPYLELAGGYNHSISYFSNIESNHYAEAHSAYLRAEAGMSYAIKKNVTLDLGFYNQTNLGHNWNTSNKSGIKVGINFHFDGKKNKE